MQTALFLSKRCIFKVSSWGVWSLLVASSFWGCAGARDAERQEPEAFRTKSDYQQPVRVAGGDVLGANQQDPSDTLRALPTNLHPAVGWEIEKGRLVRAEPGSADAVRAQSLACARALAAPGEPAVVPRKGRAVESSRETALLALGPNCDSRSDPRSDPWNAAVSH